MIISNYLTKAIHTFQFATINKLGFMPRVSLCNKSGYKKKQFLTNYIVKLKIVFENGLEQNYDDFPVLKYNQLLPIDCAKFFELDKSEAILTFSLIPERYIDQDYVDISREELWSLLSVQDHYVEFYNGNFASGVLYSCGAFNYTNFSKESTTIIQTPKIYLSNEIDTYLSVINNSVDHSYSTTAILKCSLMSSDGEVSTWIEEISPYENKLINFKEKIPNDDFKLNDLRKLCFYGVCRNATVLPLTVSMNSSQNTLAIEHSLAPMYYSSNMRGEIRRDTIKNIDSNFFNLHP